MVRGSSLFGAAEHDELDETEKLGWYFPEIGDALATVASAP